MGSLQGAPAASHWLGVGGGGVGEGGVGLGGVGAGGGPPEPPGHSAHQHTFPPPPQPLWVFSVEQLPPAVDPSAQIVAGRGAFLVQIYLKTFSTGGLVGAGVGGLVGGGNVGGFVGAFVGGLVGTGVGGGFVGKFVGAFVGFGVGGGFVGNAVGLGVGGGVGNAVGFFVGIGVGLAVGGLTGAGVGGGVVGAEMHWPKVPVKPVPKSPP